MAEDVEAAVEVEGEVEVEDLAWEEVEEVAEEAEEGTMDITTAIITKISS